MNWLELDGITKKFGKTVALHDVTIKIDSNRVGIFGPNGSGKSTLIRVLTGLIENYEGSLLFSIPKEDIRLVPETPKLPENYTILEWVNVCRSIHGESQIPIEDLLSKFKLNPKWRISNLSAGQYRKTAILPIFFGTPDLIILDEPTNFLDIISRNMILEAINDLFEVLKCKSIIASHRMDEIRAFSDEIIVLENGYFFQKLKKDMSNKNDFIVMGNNKELFEEQLNNMKLKFQDIGNELGEFKFVLTASKNFWISISNYMEEGGRIFLIRPLDTVDDLLEVFLNEE